MPMTLLNYFPLYLLDSETFYIPNVTPNGLSLPMFLNSLLDFANISQIEIFETANPSSRKNIRYFDSQLQPVLNGVPELNLTVSASFDIICAESGLDVVGFTFPLFVLRVYETSKATKLAELSVSLRVDLAKTTSARSGTQFYKGDAQLLLSYTEHPTGSKYAHKSANIPVDDVMQKSAFFNYSTTVGYAKTKYKNLNFFSVVKPQSILVNVSSSFTSGNFRCASIILTPSYL